MKLSIKPLANYAQQTLDYIQAYRKGEITSLLTDLDKLNKALLNGIEWNRIFTIAAMSGGGKSTLSEQIKRRAAKLNEERIDILSFEFEMPIQDLLIRNTASSTNSSVKDLLLNETKISDEDLQSSVFKSVYPDAYCVDQIGSVDDVVETVLYFVDKRQDKQRPLVVTLDHVLLTKGKAGDEERTIIAELYRRTVALKKTLISMGIRVIFIYLSQLNREIEKTERKLNPDLHYPNRNDLFGSNDIFMCSDYVVVLHRPSLLGLNTYGPLSLPIHNPDLKKDYVYFHIIKQRFDSVGIIQFLEDFRNSRFIDPPK